MNRTCAPVLAFRWTAARTESKEVHKHYPAFCSQFPEKKAFMINSPPPSTHPQGTQSLVLAMFVLLAERTAERAK